MHQCLFQALCGTVTFLVDLIQTQNSVEAAAHATEKTAKNSGEHTEDDNKAKLPLAVIFEHKASIRCIHICIFIYRIC